jgi:GNAT superfamily N-acetyltransferase
VARGVSLSPPVAITAEHSVAGFSCGNKVMDDWLISHALGNEARASRTYVIAAPMKSVVAYYSLALGALQRSAMPRKLRHDLPLEVPVAILGRLAVDNQHSGQGLGGALIAEAIQRTFRLSSEIGVRGLVVHAIDDQAASFYKRYGFVLLPGHDRSLLLTIETMTAAVASLAIP